MVKVFDQFTQIDWKNKNVFSSIYSFINFPEREFFSDECLEISSQCNKNQSYVPYVVE